MARQYRTETEQKDKELITEILNELPNYVEDYMLSLTESTTPKTRLEYVRDIKSFFSYIAPSLQICDYTSITLKMLEDLRKKDFERYMVYLETYEKNGITYTNSRATISRKISSLRSFFSYLYSEDLIASCSILKLRPVKIPKKQNVRLSSEESKLLIDEVKNLPGVKSLKRQEYHKKQSCRDLAIIFLLLSTGIRISECVGLDINDINFNNSSVRVIRKGNKEDIVYFSDEAAGYLMEYYEERKLIKPLSGHENALFLSSQKKRMGVRSIQIMIKKYAGQISLSKITPHALRRTYGTELYKETEDLYLVAEALGHANVDTARIYAKMSDEHKKENRNKIIYTDD